MVVFAILAAYLSAFMGTISGVLSKKISVVLGNAVSAMIVMVVGIIPMIIGTILLGQLWLPAVSVLLAIVAGVFLVAGFLLIFKALETEQLSNSKSLGVIQQIVLIVFGIFVLGESLTALESISILLILMGSLFVLTTTKLKINIKLIPAVLSPASWAIYWIFLTYAVNLSGNFAMPVTIARITGAALMLIYCVFTRPAIKAHFDVKKNGEKVIYLAITLAVVAALTNAMGDFAFSFVVGAQAVSIGSALGILSLIVTVIISVLIYRDKLTRLQVLGIAITIAGALAIAIA